MSLNKPAQGDTQVTVRAAGGLTLVIIANNPTVPDGETTGTFLLVPLFPSPETITATLDNTSVTDTFLIVP